MAGLANMDFETKESSVGVREGADLGEEERRQALTFVPEVLAAPLHAPFKLCVLKEEEEDGEAFDLGESNLS